MVSCNKNYSKKIDEGLKKRSTNTFKFSNNDINKFILLLLTIWINGKSLMKHHCLKKTLNPITCDCECDKSCKIGQ